MRPKQSLKCLIHYYSCISHFSFLVRRLYLITFHFTYTQYNQGRGQQQTFTFIIDFQYYLVESWYVPSTPKKLYSMEMKSQIRLVCFTCSVFFHLLLDYFYLLTFRFFFMELFWFKASWSSQVIKMGSICYWFEYLHLLSHRQMFQISPIMSFPKRVI